MLFPDLLKWQKLKMFHTILGTVEPRLSGLVGLDKIDRIIEGPDNREYEY